MPGCRLTLTEPMHDLAEDVTRAVYMCAVCQKKCLYTAHDCTLATIQQTCDCRVAIDSTSVDSSQEVMS